MKGKKKLLLIVTLAAVLLMGSLGGVALAQDTEEEEAAAANTLLDRALVIYEENTGVAIDAEALKDALREAQQERRSLALQNYLDRLVEEGSLTQEQAQEYESWIESKPDVPLPGPRGMAPFPGRMGKGHAWGGFCAPTR